MDIKDKLTKFYFEKHHDLAEDAFCAGLPHDCGILGILLLDQYMFESNSVRLKIKQCQLVSWTVIFFYMFEVRKGL